MNSGITIIKPEEAKTLWIIRDKAKFMGEVEGTELAAVDFEVPPGSGTPPHQHPSLEIFRVHSGEITFGLFGEGEPQMVVAGPGSVVTVPSMASHNYTNLSGKPATMMVVLEKSMITFFEELGQEDEPQGPVTPEEIDRIISICNKHGITILPSPQP